MLPSFLKIKGKKILLYIFEDTNDTFLHTLAKRGQRGRGKLNEAESENRGQNMVHGPLY